LFALFELYGFLAYFASLRFEIADRGLLLVMVLMYDNSTPWICPGLPVYKKYLLRASRKQERYVNETIGSNPRR